MFNWKWPGYFALTCIHGLFWLTIGALVYFAPNTEIAQLFQDRDLWRVIRFTLLQALLSMIIAVIPALFIAYALYRREFIFKSMLIKLCSITLILPSLVVVFGLISIYGRNGILITLLESVGLSEFKFNLYGLGGILLAHTFFNLPFACLIILKALESIPTAHRKLAAQLNFRAIDSFRVIDWPILKKQMMSVSVLIFTLCFSSFSIILTLGGGPKATTIELAIYQALTYDYDFNRAAYLALLQVSLCLCLMVIAQLVKSGRNQANTENSWKRNNQNYFLWLTDALLITFICLLILPPLLAIVISGINLEFWHALLSLALLHALKNSLVIGLSSAILALTFANLLIWTARQFELRYATKRANLLITSGSVALVTPSLVIATGIYLLLFHFNLANSFWASPYVLVSLVNSLMALPFVINLLHPYLTASARNYQILCDLHAIRGLTRWWYIDVKANQQHLQMAFAFAFTLSLGDVGVMAFLGTQHSDGAVMTLPYLLFLQLGSYQSAKAEATAFLLLLLVLGLFYLIARKNPSILERT